MTISESHAISGSNAREKRYEVKEIIVEEMYTIPSYDSWDGVAYAI